MSKIYANQKIPSASGVYRVKKKNREIEDFLALNVSDSKSIEKFKREVDYWYEKKLATK